MQQERNPIPTTANCDISAYGSQKDKEKDDGDESESAKIQYPHR